MDKIIAVPAESNEGLSAPRSDHLGRAAYVAVVRAGSDADPTVLDTLEIATTPGGRHGMPAALKQLGVTDLVTVGIGQGMVSRLNSEDINIWIERSGETVAQGVAAFVAGEASPLSEEDVRCASDEGGGCP